MSNIESVINVGGQLTSRPHEGKKGVGRADPPLVSLVLPAFNEAKILHANLSTLCDYMESLRDECRWELILVNDGSTDETGTLADRFATNRENVHVIHHPVNLGLGQALRSGFASSRGDYVITLDADMSYSPEHIGQLLAKIRETRAKIVAASPYAEGGKLSAVPWMRRTLSVWANRFLVATSRSNLSTLTGMVRAYDGSFVRSLDLRSMGMDVNPEAIYKAMLLRARVEEIPAHLDWHPQGAAPASRPSSMRVARQILAVLLSGFFFKPFLLFLLPGCALLVFSLYTNTWLFIHFLRQYRTLTQYTWFLDRASFAVGAAYSQFPHTFIVGLMSAMLAIQLISLGILALQSKRYFEEIFHLGTTIYRSTQKEKEKETDHDCHPPLSGNVGDITV